MRLVWSKSKLPLSLVIRWATGEDCSHFSIVFETASKGLQFESNLLGTHPKFWENSKKHLVIVHEKVFDLPLHVEDQIWDLVVSKYDGKSYDYPGVLYIGWRKFLSRVFGKEYPKKNAWADSNSFFCNELYDIFNHIEGFPNIDVDGGMDTPHDVWERLKDFEYKPPQIQQVVT